MIYGTLYIFSSSSGGKSEVVQVRATEASIGELRPILLSSVLFRNRFNVAKYFMYRVLVFGS